jgi:hypothetical protein
MMHAFDPFNAPQPHAVDIHFEALSFDGIAVAFGGIVAIDKLAGTIDTDVILFTASQSIFTDMGRATVWTLHQILPRFIPPLCNAEYFCSQQVQCACCSHRTHQNGTTTYFHRAILPVLVCPTQSCVVSLPPEFITPQDGHDKQDCESAAAKRWLEQYHSWFESGTITLLGDDLYSRQPLCQWASEREYHYIFSCLPTSHRTLYEWLDFLAANGEVRQVQHRHRHGKDWHRYTYRWVNQIPLRNEQPAILVNWCELTITRASDDHQIYHNAWITDHFIHPDTVVEIAAAARARWKTENENHNVLKTKGYHLDHNFGHGKHHLSAFLLTFRTYAERAD